MDSTSTLRVSSQRSSVVAAQKRHVLYDIVNGKGTLYIVKLIQEVDALIEVKWR